MDAWQIVMGSCVPSLGGLLRASAGKQEGEARKPKDGSAKHGVTLDVKETQSILFHEALEAFENLFFFR